jgi:hypothetical protein
MNKDISVTSKKDISVAETLNVYDDMLELCNDVHMKFCHCQDDLLAKRIKEFKAKELDEIKALGKEHDPNVVLPRLRVAEYKAEQEVSKEMISGNVRCPFEKREIIATVKLFADKFDLKDPYVYMVVKSVINHQLSAMRMQRCTNTVGSIQEMTNKFGDIYYRVNPVEAEKREFDNSIIVAMEKLKNITRDDIIANAVQINIVNIDQLRKSIDDDFE